MTRKPARRTAENETNRSTEYGEIIRVDTIGPIDPMDARARRYVFSTRDDATELAKIMCQKTKTDEDTDLSWRTMYVHVYGRLCVCTHGGHMHVRVDIVTKL